MKKFLYTVTILFLAAITISCSADESDNYGTSNSDDVFYAKYTVKFSAEPGAFRTTPKIVNISFNGGTISSKNAFKTYSWEDTFGPMKKGQTVFLNVSSTYNNSTRGIGGDSWITSIYLKKNSGEYNLVESGGTNIKYIIK